MKKFICLIALLLISACEGTGEGAPAAGEAPATTSAAVKKGCNVKGVNDSDLGKVYYTTKHKLYQHVIVTPKQGDKMFCNVTEAEMAGFSEAPRYFSDSMANFISCLDGESGTGKCHGYVRGIYASLVIYDKACGPVNVSNEALSDAVISYTRSAPGGLDMTKYDGTARAVLKKYPCRG